MIVMLRNDGEEMLLVTYLILVRLLCVRELEIVVTPKCSNGSESE